MSNKRGDNNSFSKVCEPVVAYPVKSVQLASTTHQQAQSNATEKDVYTMSSDEIKRALASLEEYWNNPESAMSYEDFKKWLRKLTA